MSRGEFPGAERHGYARLVVTNERKSPRTPPRSGLPTPIEGSSNDRSRSRASSASSFDGSRDAIDRIIAKEGQQTLATYLAKVLGGATDEAATLAVAPPGVGKHEAAAMLSELAQDYLSNNDLRWRWHALQADTSRRLPHHLRLTSLLHARPLPHPQLPPLPLHQPRLAHV